MVRNLLESIAKAAIIKVFGLFGAGRLCGTVPNSFGGPGCGSVPESPERWLGATGPVGPDWGPRMIQVKSAKGGVRGENRRKNTTLLATSDLFYHGAAFKPDQCLRTTGAQPPASAPHHPAAMTSLECVGASRTWESDRLLAA